jgi:hypothetical protein
MRSLYSAKDYAMIVELFNLIESWGLQRQMNHISTLVQVRRVLDTAVSFVSVTYGCVVCGRVMYCMLEFYSSEENRSRL